MLKSLFLSRLVANPRGRGVLWSFMANAEESDEGAFDELVARADAPEVQKMVRLHRQDEARHGRLLRACVARLVGRAALHRSIGTDDRRRLSARLSRRR